MGRLQALCIKESKQILRDPSSALIAVVIPFNAVIHFWLWYQSRFKQITAHSG